jgi:hypothetical protein
MAGAASYDDAFGSALASGDFDGDGRDDLAVGVPGKDDYIPGAAEDGAVHIIYGSAAGLTASGDQIFTQETTGVPGDAEGSDRLGASLAACDFNGDGRDDLAIGAPGEVVNGNAFAGAINVLYGSVAGITATNSQLFHQDSSGITDSAGEDEQFGHALTAGDFDGDGRADVAVGVPFQDVSGNDGAGAVHAIYGSAAGLSASGDQVFHRDTTNIADVPGAFDFLGYALASGDFNSDGRDDLAVGVPVDDVDGTGDAGSVNIIYGSAAGLTTTGNRTFDRDDSGMAGEAAPFHNFGFSLASGDFDGDGRDDLGVGVPIDQADGTDPAAGSIHAIYGSSGGLSASGDQIFHQNTSGMADVGQGFELFGQTVSASDFDSDGRDDLAVGVPWQNVDGLSRAGAVHAIYGSSGGLTVSGDQVFHQNTSGMADQAAEDEFFGNALTGSPFVDFLVG